MKLSRAMIAGGLAAGGLLLAVGSPASAHEWCDDDYDDADYHHYWGWHDDDDDADDVYVDDSFNSEYHDNTLLELDLL
jgi:hypothetical protein